MPARLAQRAAVVGLIALAACVRRPAEERRMQVGMDTSTVRRLCAEPDSVLAGRGPCLLRDQAPVLIRDTSRR